MTRCAWPGCKEELMQMIWEYNRPMTDEEITQFNIRLIESGALNNIADDRFGAPVGMCV